MEDYVALSRQGQGPSEKHLDECLQPLPCCFFGIRVQIQELP
jgi:hypothetical protein